MNWESWRGAEELLHRGDDRADVDQGLRRDRLDVLGGHPLADHALHRGPGRCGAGSGSARRRCAAGGCRSGRCRRSADLAGAGGGSISVSPACSATMYWIVRTMSSMVSVCWSKASSEAELLVDLVAADLGQVVALGVEVVVVQQRLRGLARRRLARAQLAVDVEQRVVLARWCGPSPGWPHRLVLAELLADLLLGPAERLEQDGDVLLALAVEADADHVALVDLELQPGTPRGDDLGGVDVLVGGLVRGRARSRRRASGPAGRRRRARCR